MKSFLRRYYKEVILIFFYIAIAVAAYICWFDAMWHLWYVDLITALVIVVVGVTIGFLYIKGIEKDEEKKKVEPKEENKEPEIEAVELKEVNEEK